MDQEFLKRVCAAQNKRDEIQRERDAKFLIPHSAPEKATHYANATDAIARSEPDLLRLYNAAELRARLEDFVAGLLTNAREREVFTRGD